MRGDAPREAYVIEGGRGCATFFYVSIGKRAPHANKNGVASSPNKRICRTSGESTLPTLLSSSWAAQAGDVILLPCFTETPELCHERMRP
jgi:hypothetical protein